MEVPIGQQHINFPGYGMFWVANSITSTVMGFANRHIQEKAAEHNLEFQREMEQASIISEDVKVQEEIAFKRRLLALSRQYRQEEGAKAFSTRMKSIELKAFLQKCWPLDPQLPYVFLDEIEKQQNNATPQSLNVILMHAPLLPIGKYGQANNGDIDLYEGLEYSIKNEDASYMGDVFFHKGACVKADTTGGNANIMNIHFLMNQLPTLVVSPRYIEGKMSFTGAVWEPQASRPMIRPLLSIDFEPVIANEDMNYRKQALDLYHTAISLIIGTVRDSYMLLTQGKKPTLTEWLNDGNHEKMVSVIKDSPELHNFVRMENMNTLDALIEAKTPNLLAAYSEQDVKRMREQIESIDIKLEHSICQ